MRLGAPVVRIHVLISKTGGLQFAPGGFLIARGCSVSLCGTAASGAALGAGHTLLHHGADGGTSHRPDRAAHHGADHGPRRHIAEAFRGWCSDSGLASFSALHPIQLTLQHAQVKPDYYANRPTNRVCFVAGCSTALPANQSTKFPGCPLSNPRGRRSASAETVGKTPPESPRT